MIKQNEQSYFHFFIVSIFAMSSHIKITESLPKDNKCPFRYIYYKDKWTSRIGPGQSKDLENRRRKGLIKSSKQGIKFQPQNSSFNPTICMQL